MFEVYPGFEELELRIEVEWRGQTRMVVARLERWLDSRQAALVCQFADDEDEGEWIIVDKGSSLPYTMGRPEKLMQKTASFNEKTRVLTKSRTLKGRGWGKLESILQRAFIAEDFTVARLLELPELPPHRNLALCCAQSCRWIFGFGHGNWAAFPRQSLFEEPYSQAKAQLKAQWQSAHSETRFAWEWAALDDDQRKHQLGWPESWQAMERIMRLGVIAIISQWPACDEIYWDFTIDQTTGKFKSEFEDFPYGLVLAPPPLAGWDEFLINYFAPHWREDLFHRHICVRQYVRANLHNSGSVHVACAPTAHEQLEAKLQLREWLAGKVAPAVAASLLASLND